MRTTKIDTNALPRTLANGSGQFAEVLNRELCGAENVTGLLRWLEAGDRYAARALPATHQLLYVISGEGVITLNGTDYEVDQGAGIYLGPDETAGIAQRGTGTLKLFQLIVPIRPELKL
jgi:quercetin dioxygenase-like cupin family protein